MHVILTGATGLVGSGVLNQLLTTYMPAGRVSRVTILARRQPQMGKDNEEVHYIEKRDFENYPPELLEKLKGADACIWAQGISQTQVSKDEFIKITEQYPLAAAKAFSTLNDKFTFVYVSGEGATHNPGMFTPLFGTVKGRTELAINDLMKSHPSLRTYSMRPAVVDMSRDPAVQTALATHTVPLLLKMSRPILTPIFRAAVPSFMSPTPWLGKVLTEMAIGDGEKIEGSDVEGDGRIVPNKAARRIWGNLL